MGNCIGFYNMLELCCQCKVGDRIFLATGSQVGPWSTRVHLWRLHKMHPWWWDRDVWDNDVWTWRGHVDIVLKNCRNVLIIIFCDIGLFRGNKFGQCWTHFVSYSGGFGHWLLLCRFYSLVHISCNLCKDTWELINRQHLEVFDVAKWCLECWVLQGMGQFVRCDDDIIWGRIFREWIIVWEKLRQSDSWYPLVLVTYTQWHLLCSMEGPRYHTFTPCDSQIPLTVGLS